MPFSPEETAACQRLVALALEEDLGAAGDLTSQAVIPPDLEACTRFVARASGVLAGLPAAALVTAALDPKLRLEFHQQDGNSLKEGDTIATLAGPMRAILAAERTALNFLQHLSGIATLTRRYVDAVAGLRCRIMDTRKTIPGWRLLAKYAVRCGGGHNHRMGLYDGILIKDNHLAAQFRNTPIPTRDRSPLSPVLGGEGSGVRGVNPATTQPPHPQPLSPEYRGEGSLPQPTQEVISSPIFRDFMRAARNRASFLEIEVETLDQFAEVLACKPDIVLLDNMTLAQMRQAVALRNQQAPDVLLEASGGVNLQTVRAIAETGVDRISVGALTHSAPALDIALDFGA
jgi:nicotinate-nucleotide pyrophosphorylase (carboxylating)